MYYATVMINLERIINELEDIRAQPMLHVQPVSPEALFSHLLSVARGVWLCCNYLNRNDFVSARRHANQLRGWEDRSTSPYAEMREKKIAEPEILDEMISIEVEMWKILDQWQNENIAKGNIDRWSSW